MGRILDDCMTEFSTDDMSMLESLIASNFEDALMVSSLSKLQQHQLRLSERLNTVFADTVIKAQNSKNDQQSLAPSKAPTTLSSNTKKQSPDTQ
jgi:hypothetical protein